MRITNNVLVNNLKRNISRNMRQLDKLDIMLATGSRINRPSDDPTGIVETLRFSSRINENRKFQDNVADAKSWLENTDSALNSMDIILNRIYELTVRSSNDSLSHEDRGAIAEEVEQLIDEAVNVVNSTYGDRYIFGGTNTLQKTYEAGTWNHNDIIIEYEIGPGIKVPVNLTADEAFQANSPQDLLGTLQTVLNHMKSDDTAALGSTDLEALSQNIDNVLAARAQVGARVNRLDMAMDRLLEQEINFSALQSDVEGIDPAKVILDMKSQENVYRSALAVGARIIMPTLVDYIR